MKHKLTPSTARMEKANAGYTRSDGWAAALIWEQKGELGGWRPRRWQRSVRRRWSSTHQPASFTWKPNNSLKVEMTRVHLGFSEAILTCLWTYHGFHSWMVFDLSLFNAYLAELTIALPSVSPLRAQRRAVRTMNTLWRLFYWEIQAQCFT